MDNSEIISLMQRMDHLAHSVLQLSREFQALLDGVLAKANLLWNKIDSAPCAWNIPIEHSNIPMLRQSIISGLSTLSNNIKLLNSLSAKSILAGEKLVATYSIST